MGFTATGDPEMMGQFCPLVPRSACVRRVTVHQTAMGADTFTSSARRCVLKGVVVLLDRAERGECLEPIDDEEVRGSATGRRTAPIYSAKDGASSTDARWRLRARAA